MICHLAECLMDRALDCRWDGTASEELFRGAAEKEGVMRMGYVGELRPLSFLSETVRACPESFLFSCLLPSDNRSTLCLDINVHLTFRVLCWLFLPDNGDGMSCKYNPTPNYLKRLG